MNPATHDNGRARLAALERGATTAAALQLFDSLPAVSLTTMVGAWRGRGLATGHPLDGLLERFGWHGKRFEGPECAYPLIFETARGSLVSINPALIPIGVAVRYAALFKLPIVARLCRLGLGLLRTAKPTARLRMIEVRGVLTATMLYDALPINDAFRLVDPDTLLGMMDLRGVKQPFVFVLTRETAR